MIVNQTKQILNKYSTFAKKAYGQNFLIKEHVIDEIVKNSGIDKNTFVIEIGPGIGALTEALAINAKKVLCYEIDTQMVEILKDTLSNYDNVMIKNIDFLKVDIDKDIDEIFEKGYEVKVVANLPYYITTPIIFKLLESKKITELMFMVQKEVGARLTGKPQTKDYNALSVLMKYKTESRIVSNVSRKCFFPEPNVDSVLLHIKVVKTDYGLTNEPKFLEFIRKLFDQRRKTIVNNLHSFYKFDKAEIEQKMIELGFDINLRAEALDISQIVSLYIAIFES